MRWSSGRGIGGSQELKAEPGRGNGGSTLGASVVEQPEEPRLRLFTVEDERSWDSRPRLDPQEFALEDVSDAEWDAFYVALAER